MEERTWLWVKEVEWVLVMKNSEEETKGNYQRGCGGVHKRKFSGTFLLVICLDPKV